MPGEEGTMARVGMAVDLLGEKDARRQEASNHLAGRIVALVAGSSRTGKSTNGQGSFVRRQR